MFSNESKGETSVTHFHFIQTDKLKEFITSQSKLLQHFSPKIYSFFVSCARSSRSMYRGEKEQAATLVNPGHENVFFVDTMGT